MCNIQSIRVPRKTRTTPSMAKVGMEQRINGHIAQAKDQLTGCVERRNRQNRPAGVAPLGPKKPRAPAGPARKSTRLEGRPAPIYNEAALEKADGVERKKRGHLPEHHGATPSPISYLAVVSPPWMSCLMPHTWAVTKVACGLQWHHRRKSTQRSTSTC